ncbi:chaplin [Streptomyces sp. NBC_00247]|uniref:chaplin n=1 Tax=Streptomyces sp. NBC_00247 TaxID=2975689 RepID=UPI002E2B41C1|nr:chaplin [Streptomyces sp. NBC_00247]
MRQVTRKGLITMAAAGGVLALGGGYAQADSGAASAATNSPGVASGNSIQIPIEIPVNVCGNSVDVVGLLNPAFGNSCANTSQGDSVSGGGAGRPSGAHAGDTSAQQGGNAASGTGRHRAGDSTKAVGGGGGATAEGVAQGSPGILSGNSVQAPIDIPVNACGNSVDVVGLLNPVFGNECVNGTPVAPPVVPEVPVTPEEPVAPPAHEPPAPEVHVPPQLAETGAGDLGMLIPAGAGMLLAGAGAVFYRRSRSAA